MNQYHAAVLIGRFQPFHNGHAALLTKALDTAPHVVVLLGSSFSARNAKNPFSWEERAAMIKCTLSEADQARVRFLPIRDYYDDVCWAATASRLVEQAVGGKHRIALIGYVKDPTSHYLNRFPDWEFIAASRQGDVHATAIRQIWFEGEDPEVTRALLAPLLPLAVAHYLRGWSVLPMFAHLRDEHFAVEESRKIWGNGPFITVDAVVKASEQILLIKRGHAPGKGTWALPGGFLDGRERLLQGAIRELREETGIGLFDTILEGALVDTAVFDHPDRSTRARTITHVHFFDLKSIRPPDVAGADDAAEAKWFPIGELLGIEGELFEDHFNILNHFLKLV